MAGTRFIKLPTLDDNLRKQPNVTDLLTYLHGNDIAGKVSRDFTCKSCERQKKKKKVIARETLSKATVRWGEEKNTNECSLNASRVDNSG